VKGKGVRVVIFLLFLQKEKKVIGHVNHWRFPALYNLKETLFMRPKNYDVAFMPLKRFSICAREEEFMRISVAPAVRI